MNCFILTVIFTFAVIKIKRDRIIYLLLKKLKNVQKVKRGGPAFLMLVLPIRMLLNYSDLHGGVKQRINA